MTPDTKTAEERMVEMQVSFFKESNPHKRGWITRKMEDLFTTVMYLEACFELDYTPEDDD